MKKQLTRVLTLLLAVAMVLGGQSFVFAADDTNPCTNDQIAHTKDNCSYELKETVPAGCEVGYTIYSCKDCGDIFLADFVKENGHKYEEVKAVAPTCSAEGVLKHYKCSVCDGLFLNKDGNKVEEDDIVDKTEVPHKYDEKAAPVIKYDSEAGKFMNYKVCVNCGAEAAIEGDGAVHEHDWELVIDDNFVEPNKETGENGQVTIACKTANCGETGLAIIVSGHTHEAYKGDRIDEVGATCETEGMKAHYVCACGKYLDGNGAETTVAKLTIAKHYNNTKPAYQAATCTGIGFDAVICQKCNEVLKQEILAPLGHTYAVVNGDDEIVEPAKGNKFKDYEQVVDPTCTDEGYTVKLCTKGAECSEYVEDKVLTVGEKTFAKVYVDVVPALGHTVTTYTVAANCQQVEFTFSYCANKKCELPSTSTVTDADSKTYTIYVDAVETAFKVIDEIDAVFGEEKDLDNHVMTNQENMTPATCDKDGNIAGYCKIHGATFNVNLPAGHTWSNAIKTSVPTHEDARLYTYRECLGHTSDGEPCEEIEIVEMLNDNVDIDGDDGVYTATRVENLDNGLGSTVLTSAQDGMHLIGNGTSTIDKITSLNNNIIDNYVINAGFEDWSRVNGDIVFNNCVFNGHLHFDDVAEGVTVTFNNCTFKNAATLGGRGGETVAYIFNNCTFEGYRLFVASVESGTVYYKTNIVVYGYTELNNCDFASGSDVNVYKSSGVPTDLIIVSGCEVTIAGKKVWSDKVVIGEIKNDLGVQDYEVIPTGSTVAAIDAPVVLADVQNDLDNADLASDLFTIHGDSLKLIESATTAATCTTREKRIYECSHCNKSFILFIEGLEEHVVEEGTLVEGEDATCTEPGTADKFECVNCGTVGGEEIPALGHAYGDVVEFKAATCTDDGNYEYAACTRKDCTYVWYIDAEGHEVESDNKEDVVIKKSGHDFENTVDRVESTCEAKGVKEYAECANGCGAWAYRDPKDAETLTPVELGEDGEYPVIKDQNGNWNSFLLISEKPHSWDPSVGFNTEAATCDTPAYTHSFCGFCRKHIITEYAPALGHDFDTEEGNAVAVDAQDATCVAIGNKAFVVCGNGCNSIQYDDNGTLTVVNAGKDFDAENSATYPACVVIAMIKHADENGEFTPCDVTKEDGEQGRYCDSCRTYITIAHGATVEGDTVPETCTEYGYTTKVCELCGTILEVTIGAEPHGHVLKTESEYYPDEETATEKRFYCTCENCDYYEVDNAVDLSFTIDYENPVKYQNPENIEKPVVDYKYVDTGKVAVTIGLNSEFGFDIWGISLALNYDSNYFVYDATTTNEKLAELKNSDAFVWEALLANKADGADTVRVLAFMGTTTNEETGKPEQSVNRITDKTEFITLYFDILNDKDLYTSADDNKANIASEPFSLSEVDVTTVGRENNSIAISADSVEVAAMNIAMLFDVDGNNIIGVSDLQRVMAICAGAADVDYASAADINMDGVIDSTDRTAFMRILTGSDYCAVIGREILVKDDAK